MTKIKYVEMSDKEFETKVNSKQGYVLLENDKPEI